MFSDLVITLGTSAHLFLLDVFVVGDMDTRLKLCWDVGSLDLIRFGQNPSLPKATFIGTIDLKKVSMETQTYFTTCSKGEPSHKFSHFSVKHTQYRYSIYLPENMYVHFNQFLQKLSFSQDKTLLFSGVMYSMQDRACTIEHNDTLSILCL